MTEHILWLAVSLAVAIYGAYLFAAASLSLDDNSPLFKIGGLAFVAGVVSIICCIANWLL